MPSIPNIIHRDISAAAVAVFSLEFCDAIGALGYCDRNQSRIARSELVYKLRDNTDIACIFVFFLIL
jgi:hypothetical protein